GRGLMPRSPASTLLAPWILGQGFGPGPVGPRESCPSSPVHRMKTTRFRAQDVAERWYLYDASQHVLGHMASDIAMRLMGKDRPQFTREELTGAHVVVVNAAKVRLTGRKADVKYYPQYSGYPGGLYNHPFGAVKETRPHEVVKLA